MRRCSSAAAIAAGFLHAAGVLQPAVPRSSRQAEIRQRGRSAKGTRWIAGDIRGLHRFCLRCDRTRPCADRLLHALGLGNGYRSRRRGDYLAVLQKPPLAAKRTWRDHGIPNRWVEKVDRKIHPHVKPIGLITRLIGAVTRPGDLIIDPAAGSFVVMHAAHALSRNFVGCDLAYAPADVRAAA